MTSTHQLLAVLTTGLVLIGATACSSDDEASVPASSPETTEAFVSPIPTIPLARQQPFVAELDAIAPGLASEQEDSIANARNTCDSILGGSSNLLETTKIRFIGDGVDSMTDAQAQQIIALITAEAWCA